MGRKLARWGGVGKGGMAGVFWVVFVQADLTIYPMVAFGSGKKPSFLIMTETHQFWPMWNLGQCSGLRLSGIDTGETIAMPKVDRTKFCAIRAANSFA